MYSIPNGSKCWFLEGHNSCLWNLDHFRNENLKTKYKKFLFTNPNERPARVERIERLSSVEWQIEYLALFCAIVNHKFANTTFSTEEEKLRFYASAYNSGFHKSEQQIKETAQKSLFPHFSRQKFKYSDIAVWFYQEVGDCGSSPQWRVYFQLVTICYQFIFATSLYFQSVTNCHAFIFYTNLYFVNLIYLLIFNHFQCLIKIRFKNSVLNGAIFFKFILNLCKNCTSCPFVELPRISRQLPSISR